MNKNILEIDLLSLADRLIIKKDAERTRIFDPIRKKYLIMQPEEFVRQLLILWLSEAGGFSRNSLQVEKLVRVNGLSRRFDIVIYSKKTQPFILVECKAPGTPVGQQTFDQIAVYNMALKAPYLVVTNGVSTYCVQVDHQAMSYVFLDNIPVP